MSKIKIIIIALLSSMLFIGFVNPQTSAQSAVRSSLYPIDWTPNYTDSQGRFLHDFSYAGYRRGEAPIPDNPGALYVDVTQAPYNADPSGNTETSTAIQAAIDYVGQNGGGVVYMPPGTYRVRPLPGDFDNFDAYHKRSALYIPYNNVVLRGAGQNQTYIYNDTYEMRTKRIITLGATPEVTYWRNEPETDVTPITSDLLMPSLVIPVANASAYTAGDWVVVRADLTSAFKAEHFMSNYWTDAHGLQYLRQIVDVDYSANTLTVDIPTRYWLKTRDNARVHKVTMTQVFNVGVENLSMGMRNHPQDFNSGQGDYDMHWATGIYINYVVDGWVRNVSSYRPMENTQDIHMLSRGIWINNARSITVQNVDLRNAQHVGVNGNGYLFGIEGSDILVTNSIAADGRHNFNMQEMHTTGNVLYNNITLGSKGGYDHSDYHRNLTHANLIDTMQLTDDKLEAFNRTSYSGNAGFTATQNVYWNITKGSGFCGFRSDQYGWGYIIGTDGQCPIDLDDGTDPTTDFTEHIGQGHLLEPQSLYLDQLNRRLNRITTEVPQNVQVRLENGQPVLRWDHDQNSLWFNVYIGSDDASVTVFQGWVEKTANVCSGEFCETRISTNPSNGNYVVYMQSWGTAGFNGNNPDLWSNPAFFSIELDAPSVPSIVSVDDSTGVPRITWQKDNKAQWYQFWVGTADFQAAGMGWFAVEDADCNENTCSKTVPAWIVNGDNLVYMQSWGSGSYNDGDAAAWSEPASFNTDFNVPGLISPQPVTNTQSGYPDFTWGVANGATWYEFYVGPQEGASGGSHHQWLSSFDLGCEDGGGCSFTLPIELEEGEYVWYVRAWGPGGFSTSGPWSNGWGEAGTFGV